MFWWALFSVTKTFQRFIRVFATFMASSQDVPEKKGNHVVCYILAKYLCYEIYIFSSPSTFIYSVTLSLKPAGNAPTLKQSKFAVAGDRQVSWLLQWLKKVLHSGPEESMVCKLFFCLAFPLHMQE